MQQVSVLRKIYSYSDLIKWTLVKIMLEDNSEKIRKLCIKECFQIYLNSIEECKREESKQEERETNQNKNILVDENP